MIMPPPLHDILARQLKRYLGGPAAVPPEWKPFLQAVNDAYREFDKDRGMLERSLELSSEELIQSNADLRESQMRYRTFIDATSDLVFLKDESFRHLFINQAYSVFLGKPQGAVIGCTDFDLMPKAAAEHCRAGDQKVLKEGGTVIAEETVGPNIYQTVKFPVPLPGGRIGVGGYIRDITEHKRAEQLLLESEKRFTQVSESAGEWIWEMDAEGLYTYSNPVVQRILGYTPEELVGKKHFHELFAPHVREEIRKAAEGRTARKEAFLRLSNPVVHKDGHVVILETTGMPILDQEGHLAGYRGADTDITQRRQAEEHLRFHAQLLDSVTESIVATDLEGRILYWGRGAEKLYGYRTAEVMDQPYRNFAGSIEPPDEKMFRRNLIATGFWRGEHLQRKRNGETIWTSTFISLVKDEQGRPAGFLGIDQDITARKQAEAEKAKLEAELQQTRKMESVGRLAGGVAHDFNNMLGVILGRAEMAIEQVDPEHPIQDDLEEIRKAATRSADLTRQLLAFARKQTVAPQVLDLNRTVEGMLQMLSRLIGENIVLDWQPKAALWPVKMDPTQIDQILANLCVNARAAIAGIGQIHIATGNVAFDAAACANHAGFLPGEFVQLSVADTGCGMDRETLGHIFEPFFTTKGIGEGTGLGLATIYGIVKQNNGFIHVSSEPGQGTTFKIYLPRHVGTSVPTPRNSTATPAAHGIETILLVEDEPSILDMTRAMLEKQGYTVWAAPTPGQAIQLAREHTGAIHLLMTDVVMPEMNGRDLAQTLRARHPDLKLLFMSGYTADVIALNGVLEDGMHFIQKPFAQQELAVQIRHALDSGNINRE
jgi:two-component system, cell cycle sensor histidine kinase and response regulator CckA